MTVRHLLTAVAISAAAWAMPAAATDGNPFGPAKRPYAADGRMAADGHTMTFKLFVDGPRERRETSMRGGRQVMILDRGRRTAVMLMPERKMAMNTDFAKARGKADPENMRWTTRALGQETVGGVRATKHRVDGTGRRGEQVGGFVWTTADAIVVRMELDVAQRGRTSRFTQELSNLKVGPQAPQLFVVPSDYQTMKIPQGIPGMPQGIPGMPGQPTR